MANKDKNSIASPLEAADAEGSANDAADRLDSWKDIAAFFNRSVRTVQRWEMLENMPVHRHFHRTSGSVFAYRHELDQWHTDRSLGRFHLTRTTVERAATGALLQAEQALLRTLLEAVLKQLGEEPSDSTTAPEYDRTFHTRSRRDQRSVTNDARSPDGSRDGNHFHSRPLLPDVQ